MTDRCEVLVPAGGRIAAGGRCRRKARYTVTSATPAYAACYEHGAAAKFGGATIEARYHAAPELTAWRAKYEREHGS